MVKNDVIVGINGQSVKDFATWNVQLNLIHAQQSGLCVPFEFASKNKILSLCDLNQCCQANDAHNLCFVMHSRIPFDIDQEDCELNKHFVNSNLNHYFMQNTIRHSESSNIRELNFIRWHRAVCLPVRNITELASQFCNDSFNCMQTYFGNYTCLRPYSSQSLTRLIVIEFENKKSNILFWGPVPELYQAIILSDIIPRLPFMPIMTYKELNVFFK